MTLFEEWERHNKENPRDEWGRPIGKYYMLPIYLFLILAVAMIALVVYGIARSFL